MAYTKRKCLECGEKIIGRTDKIFCDISCKNNYHYIKNLKKKSIYQKIDKILRTNRKLLKKLNHRGYKVINQSELFDLGFNPNFFTHSWKNIEGITIYFVYDFGFQYSNDKNSSKFILLEWKDYMNTFFFEY